MAKRPQKPKGPFPQGVLTHHHRSLALILNETQKSIRGFGVQEKLDLIYIL